MDEDESQPRFPVWGKACLKVILAIILIPLLYFRFGELAFLPASYATAILGGAVTVGYISNKYAALIFTVSPFRS